AAAARKARTRERMQDGRGTERGIPVRHGPRGQVQQRRGDASHGGTGAFARPAPALTAGGGSGPDSTALAAYDTRSTGHPKGSFSTPKRLRMVRASFHATDRFTLR